MFHRSYSILLAATGLALTLGANVARADDANYMGRWTVNEEKPVYSSKGKLYKTIDVAPCGKDFCGVSVSEDKTCGKTLFRFLTIHADNVNLTGHGLWGTAKKKLQLEYSLVDDKTPSLGLGLGEDSMDFGGREGSDPLFDSSYKKIGDAACLTN
jgi:hypothetical protein